MSLAIKRDELITEAKNLVDGAKAAGRGLTDDEFNRVESIEAEVKSITEQMQRQAKANDIMASFTQRSSVEQEKSYEERKAASIGEHIVKSADLSAVKAHMGTQSANYAFPEFKAASDVHTVPTSPAHLILPDIDTNIVRPFQQRLFLADWLLSGGIESNAITYFVENTSGALEGDFKTVAENSPAAELHFGGYTEHTETLRKVMGIIKISKEMFEDANFLVSEINTRLLRQLAVFEEKMLLDGSGSGTDVKGLLKREGLQTKEAANADALADTIYEALTAIELATGFTPNAIVINPADYQKLRLAKDSNQQYYAGGPFGPSYGNGTGVIMEPPIWGVPVIKTPAIPAKTILVGSGDAATVYRKGGIEVDTAFQNEDDFKNDRVAIRARERLALAVRTPAAFCKITVQS